MNAGTQIFISLADYLRNKQTEARICHPSKRPRSSSTAA
jgi:hypothetical protein